MSAVRHTPLRFLAVAALALLLSSCSSGSSRGESSSEDTPSRVPAAYEDMRVVYATGGDSFFGVRAGRGEPGLIVQAEGQTGAGSFVGYLPESSELVYEAVTEGGREIWLFSEGSGESRRVAEKIGSVLGIRRGEIVYSDDEDRLVTYDPSSEEQRVVFAERPVLGAVSFDGEGPICFTTALDGEGRDPGQTLHVFDPEAMRVTSVAETKRGRRFAAADATSAGIAYVDADVRASGFGTVFVSPAGASEPIEIAQESRLVAVAPDGGVLVQQMLRGGVSGVRRTRLTYVPALDSSGGMERQSVGGSYVGVVHSAAFVDPSRLLLSARTDDAPNVLELHDLSDGSVSRLLEDPDERVIGIEPLDASAALCIRSRPGISGPDLGGVSLEDELLWTPLDEAGEPAQLASTRTGYLRVAAVLRP